MTRGQTVLPHCPAVQFHVPEWASTALPCLLTRTGERLARLPVEPMYGKVLLARWAAAPVCF